MKGKTARSFVILATIATVLAMSGCLCSLGHSDVTPTPVAGTPVPSAVTPTPQPGGYTLPDGYTLPNGTWAWGPGNGDTNQDNYTVSPTPSPQPFVSAQAKDWGTSKDTFARGETATGWVYVTNTGNVPIDALDFTIVIKKTIFFVPIEKSYDYGKTGLNIAPGETRRVEFSQAIPSEYSGVSTAGDYQLTVTAKLAGEEIGHYSKGIKVV
jgi:hypothetical protein